jgi:hypothetical protein
MSKRPLAAKAVPDRISDLIAELEAQVAGMPQPGLRHLWRAVIYLRAARDGADVDERALRDNGAVLHVAR